MFVLKIASSQPKRRKLVVEGLLETHILCCPEGSCATPVRSTYARRDAEVDPGLGEWRVHQAVASLINEITKELLEDRGVGYAARPDSRVDDRLHQLWESFPPQEPMF